MNKLITVAVIDSGIYPHIDFKNRIVAFKDFVNGRKNAYDDCGHGTHVSGIIAGSGYASHHAYPGGLATHTAANLCISEGIYNTYKDIFNSDISRDIIISAQALHDLAKPLVFQWQKDQASLPEYTIAATGAHHILSIAEVIYRGFPVEEIVAQACAHTIPTGKDEQVVAGYLKAAAIIAGKDAVKLGLVNSDNTIPTPHKQEGYIVSLGDHDFVLSSPACQKSVAILKQIAAKDYGMTKAELLELAAYAEDYSNHPISLSIKRAYGKDIKHGMVKNIEEIAGHGVRAVIGGQTVLCGNGKLMQREKISYTPCTEAGTVIYAAVDGKFAGYILIEDEVKADAAAAIKMLKTCGVRETVMLTGDSDAVGQKIAKRLGLDRAFTQLLPADKVEHVERLLLEALHKRSNRGKLAFVGDGIKGAPVRARADVGIAMGALGSDAAIEAADIVLMTDEPSKIASAIKIARKTLSIVRQNIIFAIGIKIAVLALGALGYASMWAAVFADVGVSVIAILNAVRALNVNKYKKEQARAAAVKSSITPAAETAV